MSSLGRAYAKKLRASTPRVAELAEQESELTWQARWFSGACGRKFEATSGDPVVVTDFGHWNGEAGPDFIHACVRINGRDRRGSIEVDLEPSGWEQHGHATNRAYDNVVLHVVVRRGARRHFPRTASNREVTQVFLSDHTASNPEWSATAVARPGRCLAPLRELPPERLTELLAVAARHRLERKGAALRAMIEARGVDAAIYEAVATAMGYKNNKLPFQLLSQRVPVKTASARNGEALLFGLAGFLEREEPPPGEAKSEAVRLWAAWWKERGSYLHAILPRTAWNLSGIRPANHPLRRIAALSAMARRWKNVRRAIESADLLRLTDVLGSLEHPFWSFHTTWNSVRRRTPLALIGSDRIREIHANIALPLAIARGREPDWQRIPAGPANTSLRVVSARLFGGPLPRSLPKRMYVHQGLLQIYADFCLRDSGECERCRFPSLVAGLSS